MEEVLDRLTAMEKRDREYAKREKEEREEKERRMAMRELVGRTS